MDNDKQTERHSTAEQQPRGLRAQILTGTYHSPNGGLSASVHRVTVIGEGIPALHQPTAGAPAVRLDRQHIGGVVAVPVEPLDGRVGYMASGAYVLAAGFSDEWAAAVGTHLPIPLHDRSETPEEYAAHCD